MTDVLIAGGGTGGHLFPGIAVAQEVRRRDENARVLFVGTERGIEMRAVPKAGFELALLPVSGLRRTGIKGAAIGLSRLPLALVKAFGLVRRFAPEVAVSVGGYAAGPAVLASRLLGIPCVVLEQNAVPGFTNKLLGRLVRRVIAAVPVRGFDESKVRVLGNPVRTDLLRLREVAYEPETPLRVLVFGGSQGARALNETMMQAAPLLARSSTAVRIVHQTGKADVERVEAAYREAGIANASVCAFIDDMSSAYQSADLVLCRAGATTIAELTVCGRPSILVPYPFAVDDHQTANAKALVEAGAAELIPQSELHAERLVRTIDELAKNRDRLFRMAKSSFEIGRPDAAAAIVDALEEEVRDVSR